MDKHLLQIGIVRRHLPDLQPGAGRVLLIPHARVGQRQILPGPDVVFIAPDRQFKRLRRQREASISRIDYNDLVKDFLMISNNEYHLLELSDPIISESQRLLETYPLRAGDASAQ